MAARFWRVDRLELAAVFAGGALGTLARAALARSLPHPETSWPWATFAANLVAAALLGFVVTRWPAVPPEGYRRPLLATGFCGGLSTFSTMQVELLAMLDAHAYSLAAGYAGASLVAGYGVLTAIVVAARRRREVEL